MICLNCSDIDHQIAIFYCKTCKSSSMNKDASSIFYFCKDCSILHTRIRQFRNHSIVKLQEEDNESDSDISSSKQSSEYGIVLLRTMHELFHYFSSFSFMDLDFIEELMMFNTSTSLVVSAILSCLFFLITKIIFGKLNHFVGIVVLIVLSSRVSKYRNLSNKAI